MIQTKNERNAAYENLLTRRSIRQYTEDPVSMDEMEAVLTAGMHAPSAKGLCSPYTVALMDRDEIRELSEIVSGIQESVSDTFYGAPSVVCIFSRGGSANGVQDASLLAGNIMNAANALGLGTCWVNRAQETFETPAGMELLKTWRVPHGYVALAFIVMGHPEEERSERRIIKKYVIRQ